MKRKDEEKMLKEGKIKMEKRRMIIKFEKNIYLRRKFEVNP